MILISLNLIACSSSGGGGESTPAADNGDDGNNGGGDDGNNGGGDDGNDGGSADDADPFPKLTVSGLNSNITFSNDDFQDTKLEINNAPVSTGVLLFSGTSLPMPACMLPTGIGANFLALIGENSSPPPLKDTPNIVRTCPEAPLLEFKFVSYVTSPQQELSAEVKFDLGNPTDPSDETQRQALLEKLNALDGLTLDIRFITNIPWITLTFGIEQPME